MPRLRLTASAPAYAKINLNLRIKGLRDDGFHKIESLASRLTLADELHLKVYDQVKDCEAFETCKLIFENAEDAFDLPSKDNLLCRILSYIRNELGGLSEIGFKSEIIKRIPRAAGFGGASVDAAALLDILTDDQMFSAPWPFDLIADYLYSINGLSETQELEIDSLMAAFGSDIGFAYNDCPAIMRGKGDLIQYVDLADKFRLARIAEIFDYENQLPEEIEDDDELILYCRSILKKDFNDMLKEEKRRNSLKAADKLKVPILLITFPRQNYSTPEAYADYDKYMAEARKNGDVLEVDSRQADLNLNRAAEKVTSSAMKTAKTGRSIVQRFIDNDFWPVTAKRFPFLPLLAEKLSADLKIKNLSRINALEKNEAIIGMSGTGPNLFFIAEPEILQKTRQMLEELQNNADKHFSSNIAASLQELEIKSFFSEVFLEAYMIEPRLEFYD